VVLTPTLVGGIKPLKRLEKKMVCENYENCGNFLYNFESHIDSNDGKFISRKYYCSSCYKEIDIDLANDELLFAERQR
jgi:hypothetical protein